MFVGPKFYPDPGSGTKYIGFSSFLFALMHVARPIFEHSASNAVQCPSCLLEVVSIVQTGVIVVFDVSHYMCCGNGKRERAVASYRIQKDNIDLLLEVIYNTSMIYIMVD